MKNQLNVLLYSKAFISAYVEIPRGMKSLTQLVFTEREKKTYFCMIDSEGEKMEGIKELYPLNAPWQSHSWHGEKIT